MMTLRSSWPLLVLLVFAVMFPSFGEKYYVDLVMKIMILSVFALSLELLVGQTGLVSFGHAAFFGIGAYVAALLSPQSGPASFWLLFPAALGAAGLYALAVGALSLRTRGIYFIMVTLAFAQMAYYVFHDTKVGGGSDGIYLYFRPEIAIGSVQAARSRPTPCLLFLRVRRTGADVSAAGRSTGEPLRPRARRHPR